MFKKIDLYYNVDYIGSTNQSKTCKEAKAKMLDRIESNKHSLAGTVSIVHGMILKRPDLLKAYFDKSK